MSEAAHSEWDVVIVGAGPVGGYLGRELSRLGMSVLLLEEHREVERTSSEAQIQMRRAMNRGSSPASIIRAIQYTVESGLLPRIDLINADAAS